MKYLLYIVIFIISLSSCITTKKLANETSIQTVINKARTYIGTPYKWGGTSSKGMDCSGLLVRSFQSIDLNIPRTTSEQVYLGKKVKLKKSKKGDLVFFAFGKKKKKVTHVGLISDIKSNEKIDFIHASSSKGVIETKLNREYYLKRIRVIRRIL